MMSTEEKPSPAEKAGEVPIGDSGTDSSAGRLQSIIDETLPRWYVRLFPGQRHLVNQLVAEQIRQFQSQLVAQDKADSELARQIGELTAQVVQLNRRLEAIEEQLDSLRKSSRKSGGGPFGR